MKRLILTTVLTCIASTTLIAQNEVLRQIHSLEGIASFGVTVTIEHPGSFTEIDFEPASIRREILKKLERLSVTIIGDERLKASDDFPLLTLHINLMDAGNGTYPFAADLTFYQPVKLSLNRDIETMASTWQTAFVGIFSQNLLDQVVPNAVELTEDFINDYTRSNQ